MRSHLAGCRNATLVLATILFVWARITIAIRVTQLSGRKSGESFFFFFFCSLLALFPLSLTLCARDASFRPLSSLSFPLCLSIVAYHLTCRFFLPPILPRLVSSSSLGDSRSSTFFLPLLPLFAPFFFFLFFFFLFRLFLSAIQLFTSLSSSSLPSCPTVTVTFFLRFLPLPSSVSANSVFPSSRTLLLLERCPRSVRGFLDLGRWPRVKWWYKINCVARNYCPGKLCEENRGDVFTTHWDDRVFPRIFFKTFVNVVEVEKMMLLFDFTRRTTYASFSWFRLVFERMGCHLLISYSRIS